MAILFKNKSYLFNETPLRIQLAIALSFIYWYYLALTTQMIIVHDAIGYENSARILEQNGLLPYFKSGLSREPIFIAMVAFSMAIAKILNNVSYQLILVFFNILILLISQILIYKILKIMKINTNISAFVLLYFGFSPAIVNTAFSLWSEIIAYPIILTLAIVFYKVWVSFLSQEKSLWLRSCLFGILLLIATLVKGPFEGVALLFVFLFIILILFHFMQKNESRRRMATVILIFFVIGYYTPLLAYKTFNKMCNNNFAVTDRGSSYFYGSTLQRLQEFNHDHYLSAIFQAPDLNLCENSLPLTTCEYWSSRTADEIRSQKEKQLAQQGLSNDIISKTMINSALFSILQHPLKYAYFYIIGFLQMFLWEGTNIGFVIYPQWLENIFSIPWFNPLLSLTIDFLTICSFLFTAIFLFKKRDPMALSTLALILFFSIIYGFFTILKRYSLPLAPLHLILIAFTLQNILNNLTKKNFKHPMPVNARFV